MIPMLLDAARKGGLYMKHILATLAAVFMVAVTITAVWDLPVPTVVHTAMVYVFVGALAVGWFLLFIAVPLVGVGLLGFGPGVPIVLRLATAVSVLLIVGHVVFVEIPADRAYAQWRQACLTYAKSYVPNVSPEAWCQP